MKNMLRITQSLPPVTIEVVMHVEGTLINQIDARTKLAGSNKLEICLLYTSD